jgi:iron complex outermembrane receptor protein
VAGITARLDDTPDARKYRYRDVRTLPNGRIIETLSDARGALMEEQSSRITLFGAYFQETLRPAPRWAVDLGLRMDHTEFDISTNEIEGYDYRSGSYVPGLGRFDTDKSFDLFAPRLGVTYALDDRLNLYATLAQSDQVPSESEIKDNPELNASTARNIEAGLKGRAAAWDFDLALYYTRVEDEIVSQLVDGETRFSNAAETDKKGLEFSGGVRLFDHLRVGVGYAYSDYTFKKFEELVSGRPEDRSGNRFPYVPVHQFNLSADYRHPSGFKARVQADSWGEYYMDNANTEKYGGYDLVTSLMLGYDRGPHSVALNVDNLFDERYAIEVKKDTRGKTYYSAAAPRSYLLTYRYGF